MKTDPKNQTPIRALSHPEHPETDNNKRQRYEVTVYRTEYLWCKVRVQSTNEEEAKQIGNDLASEDGQCETADAEQYVHSVETIQEGEKENE